MYVASSAAGAEPNKRVQYYEYSVLEYLVSAHAPRLGLSHDEIHMNDIIVQCTGTKMGIITTTTAPLLRAAVIFITA